jgi:hypothetical protein
MDMRFGTWNVRGIYRLGSLKTVIRELGKYVRLAGSKFFHGEGMKIII